MISDNLARKYIERLERLLPLYKSGSDQAHNELSNLISDIKLLYKDDIPELNEVVDGYNTYLDRSASTIIEILEKYIDGRKVEAMVQTKDKVFIVHGHDQYLATEVALVLERAGFNPIILHEKANAGRTIIEKIEHYSSDVVYAVVLYTPCDLGRDKNVGIGSEKYRARQNVVFEHGYLMAKLGRRFVSALVKGNVETPGDIDGIVYIPVDNSNDWKSELAKNMGDVGISVDLNRIL